MQPADEPQLVEPDGRRWRWRWWRCEGRGLDLARAAMREECGRSMVCGDERGMHALYSSMCVYCLYAVGRTRRNIRIKIANAHAAEHDTYYNRKHPPTQPVCSRPEYLRVVTRPGRGGGRSSYSVRFAACSARSSSAKKRRTALSRMMVVGGGGLFFFATKLRSSERLTLRNCGPPRCCEEVSLLARYVLSSTRSRC